MGKNENEKRLNVSVRFTKNEHEHLRKCVEEAGFRTINGYIRKMALNGYIIKLDLKPILEPVKLMRNIASSINQISMRVNSTGNIYAEDVAELKGKYDSLSKSVAEILAYISRLEE